MNKGFIFNNTNHDYVQFKFLIPQLHSITTLTDPGKRKTFENSSSRLHQNLSNRRFTTTIWSLLENSTMWLIFGRKRVGTTISVKRFHRLQRNFAFWVLGAKPRSSDRVKLPFEILKERYVLNGLWFFETNRTKDNLVQLYNFYIFSNNYTHTQ